MIAAAPNLDALIDGFRQAWLRSSEIDLGSFLPRAGDPLYRAALRELIRTDLSLHWRSGKPRSLDDYRTRFPELFDDPDSLRELAVEEYRLRYEAGQSPSREEFAHRYDIPPDSLPAAYERTNNVRIGRKARPTPAGEEDAPGPVTVCRPSIALDQEAKQLFDALHGENPETVARLTRASSEMPTAGDEYLGFHLLAELGRGAFGRVFLARQEALAGRLVALKVSPRGDNESQTLAQLQHTHIVPIFSVHYSGPHQAVCMPYSGSTTLFDLIAALRQRSERPADGRVFLELIHSRKRPPGVPDPEPNTRVGTDLPHPSYSDAVLRLGAQLAEGLAHAHERGILHRDIKPANILMADDGTPMLLDFNVSEDTKQRGVVAASIGGTLPYMAPEQIAGYLDPQAPLDGRADLFSLGIVLFELLTGQFPFGIFRASHGGYERLARQILEDRRGANPCPRLLDPGISPAAAAIVRHCLQADPDRRYPSALALCEDIERHLRDEPLLHAPNPSIVERGQKWFRRHPRALLRGSVAMGLLLLLVACGLGWGAVRLHRADQARRLRAAFREDYHLAQFLLNTRPPTGQQRSQGEDACRQALERYRVLDGAGWEKRWHLTALPAEERRAVRGEIGELLLLLARTVGQDSDALPAAQRLNDAARIAFAPESPPALDRQRAWLLDRSGKRAEASELRKEAEQAAPRTPRDRALLARELTAEARFREARPMLEKAVREAPNDYWTWFLLGVCCDGLGQDAHSATCYSVCIALEPDFHGAHYNRGLAYLRQRKAAEACGDFDRVVELSPGLAEVYLDRALARAGGGDVRGAIADLDEALAREIPLTRVYFMRSRFRRQLGDRAGADKDHAAGLALEPGDELSWIARGLARMGKEPEAALKDFDAALKLNPRSRAALMNRAHVLAEKLDRQKEGSAELKRLLELYPDHAPALAGLAVVLARLDQRDQAHARIAEALARDTGGEIRYQAACVFALTTKNEPDDADQALAHLRKALDVGYGLDMIATDADLAPVRDRPAFKKLIEASRQLRPRQNAAR